MFGLSRQLQGVADGTPCIIMGTTLIFMKQNIYIVLMYMYVLEMSVWESINLNSIRVISSNIIN